MLMVGVVIEHAVKTFGSVRAVDDVSLKIEDKEFIALLGPSGCGKTTTLRLVAGLETLTGGNVMIGDRVVNDVPPKDRDIAMVFQSYALYPHMSVFDNIAFPLKIRKVPKQEIKDRVKEAGDLLNIGELLNRKPKELSGGQRQRVALGRAIVRRPSVFLMDEPLSNLDAKLRVHMRAELIRLQKKLETTLIYVTHDQVEAMTMSDRVAIMDKGKLLQVGSAINIYHHPDNIFVAGFIGSPAMNLIDCSFTSKNGAGILQASGFSIELPSDMISVIKEKASGSELVVGFRPEDITVSRNDIPESIKAEVYALEPVGKEIIVDLKIGDNMIRAVAPPTFSAKIGDTAYMLIHKSELHVFDRKTESAII